RRRRRLHALLAPANAGGAAGRAPPRAGGDRGEHAGRVQPGLTDARVTIVSRPGCPKTTVLPCRPVNGKTACHRRKTVRRAGLCPRARRRLPEGRGLPRVLTATL